jgi:dTMP kinase
VVAEAPGRLIVLYGVNNLGKSTQLELLEQALRDQGVSVMRRKSPNYDRPSGRVINAILREGHSSTPTELQLWQVLNIHQEIPGIKEQLAQGRTVVSEDFWGTALAWGQGAGIPREEIDAMVEGLLEPDVAILLHGKRFTDSTEAGHLHETNDDLTDRVQQYHRELADEYGWHQVAANQPVEDVHAAIMRIVSNEV